ARATIRPSAAGAWSCEACGRDCGGGPTNRTSIPSPSCENAWPLPGWFSTWAYINSLIATFRKAHTLSRGLPLGANPQTICGLLLFWREHHDHLPAFHQRVLLDCCVFTQIVHQPVQQLPANLCMRH